MSQRKKSEFVYQEISRLILSKVFVPGQRLVERSLIEQLGVSKTPIREALQRLKQDGLVSGDFYHGVHVTRFTKKEALELLEVLEIFFCATTKLAAEKATDTDLEDIKKIYDKFVEYKESGNINAYGEMDIQFHDRIARCTDNSLLMDAFRRTRQSERLLLTTTPYLPDRGPNVSIVEHREIMEAVIRRDPEAAFEAARKHIVNVRNSLIKYEVLN